MIPRDDAMKLVGLPAARISELLGTPKQSISYSSHVPNVALDPQTKDMIRKLNKLGLKLAAIAGQCGVSKTTVWNVLKSP